MKIHNYGVYEQSIIKWKIKYKLIDISIANINKERVQNRNKKINGNNKLKKMSKLLGN